MLEFLLKVLNFVDPPPPDIAKRGSDSPPFYTDLRIIIPTVAAGLALIASLITAVLCWKNR